MVSQPKPTTEKSPYYDIAQKYGVEVVFRPFIKVEGLSSKEFRQQKISILDYTAIIFTSRTAIDHFFTLCKSLRVTIPDTMKYFCTTENVSLYLQKYIVYRKRKIHHGTKSNKIEDLIPLLAKYNEKYLFPVSDVHKDEETTLLEQHKINCTNAIMYRTVSNDFTPEEEFNYDMLLFFSPQGIAALKKNFPEFEQGEIVIGCLGATTAQAAKEANLRVDIEVPSPKYTSMTVAVDDFIKENHKRR